METIELVGAVSADHTLLAHVPANVPPGEYRVTIHEIRKKNALQLEDWPILSVGKWPDGFTASREQIYGEDGR